VSVAPLPRSVRHRVVALAGQVLGGLPEVEVPAALRRVREFAPNRRAQAGAGPLAVVLERDPAFRQQVAAAWRSAHPDLAGELERGRDPSSADPGEMLAGIFLLRPPGWTELAEVLTRAVGEAEREGNVRGRAAGDRAEVARLTGELDVLRGRLAEAQQAVQVAETEITTLRRQARRLRADADRARAAARAAEARADQERADKETLRSAAAEELRRAVERADQEQARADLLRRAEREGRSLAETRLRLLVDTLVDAATGLRRELALPSASLHPADLVAEETARADDGSAGPPGRGYAQDDPARLEDLLALPRVHLLVDGYNVTKTVWDTLVLAEQRRRLVDGLTALAARTGAEVTCCFDGAEADTRGFVRPRGIRVLFSEAGTTADTLILRLVRAEPPGRVVVVVSSDAEVAGGAAALGARAVPSSVLARLLFRV